MSHYLTADELTEYELTAGPIASLLEKIGLRSEPYKPRVDGCYRQEYLLNQ